MNIIILIAGTALAAIGWQFKKHDDRIAFNENEISNIKITMANDYAKKTEVNSLEHSIKTDAERLERAMFAKLDRIEAKQDGLLVEVSRKADRP